MQSFSIIELNSYLTTLTQEWDETAAQAVVNTFHTLAKGSYTVKRHVKTKNDASLKGHTSEAGNVTISNKEVKETIEGESDAQIARVGYYKVSRYEYNGVLIIKWWDFWASDPTTSAREFGEPYPPEFGVEYDENLRPYALIRWDSKIVQTTLPLWLAFKQIFFNFYGFFLGMRYEVQHQCQESYPIAIYGKSKLKAAR